MKKLILMALVASATAIYQPAEAQISLQINIGAQPNWGPRGYNHVDYYYLPEVESYYYVPTRQFIYLERNKWVHRRSLPARYRNYDLYGGRKIVINQPRPYLQHHVYQASHSRQRVKHVEYSYRKGNGKSAHHRSSKSRGNSHHGRH
ncbi:hypothetical protein [Pedobacter insulae]|uniref:YXWGXW repeat-containing protein n=1 Tax=Pedobacter insulae TaxID=414048 RepID=A0A1I3A5Z2_9SPHI|nr:hypothetical protein [Pedobacter insulae]SFH45533.1 hypothetical protein SAMN04489864_11333 [Pedobacter insulae]